MTKCKCGHVHCCHKKTKIEEIKTTENDRPCSFMRKSCAECGQFLLDTDFLFLDL